MPEMFEHEKINFVSHCNKAENNSNYHYIEPCDAENFEAFTRWYPGPGGNQFLPFSRKWKVLRKTRTILNRGFTENNPSFD